jgi:hypothetical protein
VKRLFRYADNTRSDSLANRFRRRRFRLFDSMLAPLPRPVRVLDVGGVEEFWWQMGAANRDGLQILLLNLDRQDVRATNIEARVGDGRDMSEFEPGEFDVVFSNSVIEHLGEWPDQQRMAGELRRVGARFFVQTPNRHFPLEPHFLVPGFQFLPVAARVALVRRFALGYHDAIPDRLAARRAVEEIRLLSRRELERLFPGARIYRERVLGLTKSFVAYGGWSG